MFIVSKMTFDCRWERDDRSHARDFSKQNKSETLLDVFVYLECFVCIQMFERTRFSADVPSGVLAERWFQVKKNS